MKNNHFENLGIIVAMGNNREIGYQQNLIWKIKEDLKFFKNITMNSYIILGRNTYESMPKNLNGRKYIILTKDNKLIADEQKIICNSIDEILSLVYKENNSKFWVIGGGVVYKEFLPFVNVMHITHIDATYQNADTFFPYFDLNDWVNQSEIKCNEDNINYTHNILVRKK